MGNIMALCEILLFPYHIKTISVQKLILAICKIFIVLCNFEICNPGLQNSTLLLSGSSSKWPLVVLTGQPPSPMEGTEAGLLPVDLHRPQDAVGHPGGQQVAAGGPHRPASQSHGGDCGWPPAHGPHQSASQSHEGD